MIAQPDATKKIMLLSDDLDGYGWSADSAYYGFGVRHGTEEKRTLYFWSRETQQIKKSSSSLQVLNRENMMSNNYEVAWSTLGHHLAFVTTGDAGTIQLGIISPEGNTNRVFSLVANLANTKLLWSPDGDYVAVSSYPDVNSPTGPRWQLSVFGQDGSTKQGISDNVINTGTSDRPEWFWVDDWLVYMNTPPESDKSGFYSSLMAFDAPTQHQSLLAANVYPWSFYGPVQHLVKTEWLENEQDVAGAVDVGTGKRYNLTRGTDAPIQFIALSPDGHLALVHYTDKNQDISKIESVESSWELQLPLDADAVWSPDSTMLSSIDPSTKTVTIVRTNRVILYRNRVGEFLGSPEWQACSSI